MRRLPRTAALLVVCAALAAPAQAAIGILAVGDFGVGGGPERELGAAMRRYETTHHAGVLLTLGDNDYTVSPDDFVANWRRSFGWAPAAGIRVAGALGNHDLEVGDGGDYERGPLHMPARYYALRRGAVQLVVLNSNAVDGAQTAWLARTLAASTARWKVVAFHHPAYTCGGHEGSDDVQRAWVPLFERYGVQLVLSGHDHNYQRFRARHGVTYVVSGAGHTNLYGLVPCPASYPKRLAALEARGFLYVSAGRSTMTVTAVGLSGTTLDRVTLYP
jgi:3',5'-cyclic AMP phosphodiesterase CpdA